MLTLGYSVMVHLMVPSTTRLLVAVERAVGLELLLLVGFGGAGIEELLDLSPRPSAWLSVGSVSRFRGAGASHGCHCGAWTAPRSIRRSGRPRIRPGRNTANGFCACGMFTGTPLRLASLALTTVTLTVGSCDGTNAHVLKKSHSVPVFSKQEFRCGACCRRSGITMGTMTWLPGIARRRW